MFRESQMKTRNAKFAAIISFLILIALVMVFRAETQSFAGEAVQDAAASYKKNCAVCHSPKAEKFYDPNMLEEEQIEIIMKGKKMEKPPHMPGYEAKGMKTEEAKALVDYMKSLRQPAE